MKTNYDAIMENMDIDTLAMFIAEYSQYNHCMYCSHAHDPECQYTCYEGVKEFLKSESIS